MRGTQKKVKFFPFSQADLHYLHKRTDDFTSLKIISAFAVNNYACIYVFKMKDFPEISSKKGGNTHNIRTPKFRFTALCIDSFSHHPNIIF